MSQVLGIIGLGRMGGPIAARLAGNGHDIWGYDVAGVHRDRDDGVRAAESIAQLVATTDVILLSLPTKAACASVYDEIASAGDRRVATIVEMSTIGLDAAAAGARQLNEAGIAYVDGPLSGGIAGATTGKLSMMVAAASDVLETTIELLREIAQRCFVVGEEPGQGQAMKLINNYVSQTALAATAESAVFAERVGLDLAQMVEVLNASTGRSSASEDKFPRAVVPRTYDFGFATAAARKDIGLYLESAASVDVPRELAAASDAIWGRFDEACPDTDFTYIHKYLEDGGR